jgi:type VI protein secretion system component Hcp
LAIKSLARVHQVKEPIMLTLAKHAIAVVVVAAAASAPVAAHAESLSLNFTQVAVTHTVQDDRSPTGVQPR